MISFSTHGDFASVAIHAASLKFLAEVTTFFYASSSGNILSMKIILCLKDAIPCWMLECFSLNLETTLFILFSTVSNLESLSTISVCFY